MLQSIGREVCANDWGLFSIRENLVNHHVRHVEAHRLYAPPLWSVTDNQAHSLLCSEFFRWNHWLSHHVVYQTVATISLVRVLGIYQSHYVEGAILYCPDDLREPIIPAVADVEVPEI